MKRRRTPRLRTTSTATPGRRQMGGHTCPGRHSDSSGTTSANEKKRKTTSTTTSNATSSSINSSSCFPSGMSLFSSQNLKRKSADLNDASSGSSSSSSSSSKAVGCSDYVGSMGSLRSSKQKSSADLQTVDYVDDAWRQKAVSCCLDKPALCPAPATTRKPCTAAARDAAAAMVARREVVLEPQRDSASLTEKGQTCCGCSSDHAAGEGEASVLWDAFFADEVTNLGVLLLTELQRQMRAQHLEEANLRRCSHATASSLPSWLNLRRILQTASAGAAAASTGGTTAGAAEAAGTAAAAGAARAAIKPSSPPTAPRRSAREASSGLKQMSLPAVSPDTVHPVAAVVAPTGVDVLSAASDDDRRPKSDARMARALDSAAVAPPAADSLLFVDKMTLHTVLQLLPVLAFKESEQLLRWGERTVGSSSIMKKCVEAGWYKQPRQLLGPGTCDAMVYRLRQMLAHWISVVASFSIHTPSSNVCNDNSSGSTGHVYRSNSSCTGAFLAGRIRDERKTEESNSRSSSNASCCCSCSCSASSDKSSGYRACPSTSGTQSSRGFVAGGQCFNRVRGSWAQCRCQNNSGNFFAFAGESLQHLLLQFLHAHALITAVTWGRQAHLNEQRRFRREIGHTQTRSSFAPKPEQQQLPHMQQQDGKEKSQAHLHDFRYAQQQYVPRVSCPKAGFMTEEQCSYQELIGQWEERARSRRKQEETQQQQLQQEGQEVQEESQRCFPERRSLQSCLQRLLLLLQQRPRLVARESSGNASLVRDIPKRAQRQRQQISRCTLQLLSFCSIGDEVTHNTHEDDGATTEYAVENDVTLEELQEGETKKQQRQLQWCRQPYLQQLMMKQHVPVRLWYARPAIMPTTCGARSSVDDRERYQLASTCARHGRRDTSKANNMSMELTLQLLLCDSQLYINLAGPVACATSEVGRPHQCNTCRSISLQTTAAQQVSKQDECHEDLATTAPVQQQLGCIVGDQSALVSYGTASKRGDLNRAEDVAAALFKEVKASIPAAAQAATHMLSVRDTHVPGGVVAVEPAAGKSSLEELLTTDTPQNAEPATERLLPGACDCRSRVVTATGSTHAAAGVEEGSDITFVSNDHSVCRSHHSSPLCSALVTAGTVSDFSPNPCVFCSSSCDTEAALTRWCRLSAGDNPGLPAPKRELPLCAVKALHGQASSATKRPSSECEATRRPLNNAAAAPGGTTLTSCHWCTSSDESRSSCSACVSSTATPSAQMSAICCCCGETKDHRAGFGSIKRTAARSGSLGAVRSTDLVETPSQRILPIAAPADERRWRNNGSRCYFGDERSVGHPQELELSFRPAVLRISLLHTRGSFRSFFRTCAHTSVVIPAATAITAQHLQQHQAEPQQQQGDHQQQHLKEHHTHRAVGVDVSFRLPDLLQEETHQYQCRTTTWALTEPAPSSASGDASGSGRVDAAVTSVMREQTEATAEPTIATPTLGSDSVVGAGGCSRRPLHPLQDIHDTEAASRSEPLKACASSERCNCCSVCGGSGTHVEHEEHRGANLGARQAVTHAARSTCNSFGRYKNSCDCFTQSVDTTSADVEPEDFLVCCFFESGAVTLNGRVVQFFDNGKDGGCFPCIVDVLLLSWYGADPLSSGPSSPALLPAPQLCTDVGEPSSDPPGQYPRTSVSTCSSSSTNSGGGGALSTLQASSSSGRGNNGSTSWRTSGATSAAPQESYNNNNNRHSSSCSFSPLRACNGSEQPVDGAPQSSSTREVDAVGRSGYSPSACVSQPHQPHICLLFLAANGTLFCSGDVPSVYFPPCVTSGASSCKRCRTRGYRVLHCTSSSTPATDPKSSINRKRERDRGEIQCGGAPPLTTARYGTLYDAVWLPAVCAATHRPLLFGSLLASNTAAVALTSNLLLPRYKRRVPLHQRQLSFKLLRCDRSTCSGSTPLQPGGGTGASFAIGSLLPDEASRTGAMNSSCSLPTRCGCVGRSGGFDEAEETSVQWKLAAAAAGSGAALAILQAHTGEAVLLQQHRQEAYTVAAKAIWRGNTAAFCNAFQSSDAPLVHEQSSQRRQSQTSEETPSMGPAEFILRFVTLPDLRTLSPLQPSRCSSVTTNSLCPFCSLTEAHVGDSKSVEGRDALVPEEQAAYTLKGAGFRHLAAEILQETVVGKPPVLHAGRERDSFCCAGAWERRRGNGWNESLSEKENLQHASLLPRINSEKLQSIPPSLSFLLDERWVACCLYKDLVLLKTAAQRNEDEGSSAVGVLLTNLEEELHEWVASFFERHPHVLRNAKCMRLGFERLSKRSRGLHYPQFLTLPVSVEREKHRKQQVQHAILQENLSKEHNHEQQQLRRPPRRDLRPLRQGQRQHQNQQEENVYYQHYGQPQQLQTQPELSRECTDHRERISAASANQSHQNGADSNGEESREVVSAPCQETTLSSFGIAVAFSSTSRHHRSFNDIAQKSGETPGPRVRRSVDAMSGSTTEQVTGDDESRQKQLQRREVASTAAASGDCHTGNEVFEVEDGDGQLRLFVNTENGSFYCLNLHRRCLEAAWPEESYSEESRQPFGLCEGCN